MELLPLLGARLRGYLARAPARVEAALAIVAARNTGAPIYAGGRYAALLGGAASPCGPGTGDGVYLGCPPPRGVEVYLAAGIDGRLLRGLRRVEVRGLGGHVYLAYTFLGGEVARSYFAVEGLEVRPVKPPCPALLSRIRSELGREFTVRELVDVISARLGVGRGEARGLVQAWAERLCLLVHENGKKVILLD